MWARTHTRARAWASAFFLRAKGMDSGLYLVLHTLVNCAGIVATHDHLTTETHGMSMCGCLWCGSMDKEDDGCVAGGDGDDGSDGDASLIAPATATIAVTIRCHARNAFGWKQPARRGIIQRCCDGGQEFAFLDDVI